jgi:hypothetical protein
MNNNPRTSKYTKAWPKERIQVLKRMYGKYAANLIAERLGCSTSSVQTMASRLGLCNPSWTKEAEEYLMFAYEETPGPRLRELLKETYGIDKTLQAIYSKYKLLKSKS